MTYPYNSGEKDVFGDDIWIFDPNNDGWINYFEEEKYGTGGHPEKWIQKALAGGHKGALRETAKCLGVIHGKEKLTLADVHELETEGGITGKRAHTAETLMKLEHEKGGPMETLKGKLEKFGKVEQCEKEGDKFHIKITDGFSGSSDDTFACMGIVIESLGKGLVIEKMKTEKDLWYAILKNKA